MSSLGQKRTWQQDRVKLQITLDGAVLIYLKVCEHRSIHIAKLRKTAQLAVISERANVPR
jgi:hypothetical protein